MPLQQESMDKKKNDIRLSQHILPLEYFLTIKPDLTGFTFTGEEKIILNLKKPTNILEIHADELEITSTIFNGNLKGEISYNKDRETAIIKFSKILPKGKGELELKFSGILNDKMRGFYRSKYYVEGKEHHMAVSQFESTDARRAFPCFDEPAKKAIFNVNLIVPSDHIAISNAMEKKVKEHKGGYKIISFEPTPVMSTYLLAFVVGKFEHIEKKTKTGILVRVFVTPGKKKQAKFALEVACRTLDFYSYYFGIAYPIPVLDLIAIPDFAAGAMENWGAVTYRETALLVDEEHSSTINKQWVAVVIAHELAHQWFGNLVTMEWWTHLWLNEGFASYIEYLAIDHLFPEWNIWSQFIYMDHSRALELDGLENTHPIEVTVQNPSEISEIFDAVSYSKGSSIIRMLAEYLGENNFRKGLHKYLKNHSFANATTSDLWSSLEDVSGMPVGKIMNSWTQKAGYPLIIAQEAGDKIKLTQSRFFSSVISQSRSIDNTTWTVPIGLISKNTRKPVYYLMNKKNMLIPRKGKSWFKLNSGEKSLIRVKYFHDNLNKVKEAIENKEFSSEDRFGIIRDLFVLAEAGKSGTEEALKLYSSYKNDDSYIVWAEIASELARLSILLSDEDGFDRFENFARSIFTGIGERVGWEKHTKENHEQTLLRSVVLSSLGKYSDKETVLKAKLIFKKMLDSKVNIESDLRGVVYVTVAKNGDDQTYEQLIKLYRDANLQEEKDRIFRALCSFKQEHLIKRSLDFSFSSEVRAQDSFKAINFFMANPRGKLLAWECLKSHWDEIVVKFSGGHLFSRFVEPLEFFTKKEDAVEIEGFFKKHGAPGAERTIQQVVEKIESNADWIKRDLEKINQFLK
jgi:puromycin-sensitive aminopeptidase